MSITALTLSLDIITKIATIGYLGRLWQVLLSDNAFEFVLFNMLCCLILYNW